MSDQLPEGFTAGWISSDTWPKEQHFRGILQMHLRIVRGIASRWSIPPYLYADLYAGPGYLRHNGQSFSGSPLIFFELAHQLDGHRYDAMLFEKNPHVAAQLHQSVAHISATLGQDLRHRVFPEPCERAMAHWLGEAGRNTRRYGLIYSDPIGERIPVDLLKRAAAALPRTDILCYVAANSGAYKRGGREYGGKYWLADDIRAIGKDHAIIREPRGAYQWTFVLLTNWVDFPQWEKAGFYSVDSGRGREILDQLNFTRKERHEQVNTPIPFLLTAPTASTSGTPDSSPSGRRSSSGPAGSASGAGSDLPPSPTTLPTRPGDSSTSPRTWWPSATNATAEPTERSGDGSRER